MKRSLRLLFLALLATTPNLLAQDSKKDSTPGNRPAAEKFPNRGPADPAKTRRDKYETVRREYEAATEKYQAFSREQNQQWKTQGKAFNSLTAEEKAQYRQAANKLSPDRNVYAQRLLLLLDEDPKDDVAYDAVKWIFTNFAVGKPMEKGAKILIEHHLTRPDIGSLCTMLPYMPMSNSEQLLGAIVAKSPHRNARGEALLALAQYRMRMASFARRLRDPAQAAIAASYESFLGKEVADKLKQTDPAKLERDGEAAFEQVVKDYSDVKVRRGTIGELAGAELFEIRHLAVGKVVPDIEGTDTDGKPMKLTDYRDKVVMLDFWGHW